MVRPNRRGHGKVSRRKHLLPDTTLQRTSRPDRIQNIPYKVAINYHYRPHPSAAPIRCLSFGLMGMPSNLANHHHPRGRRKECGTWSHNPDRSNLQTMGHHPVWQDRELSYILCKCQPLDAPPPPPRHFHSMGQQMVWSGSGQTHEGP